MSGFESQGDAGLPEATGSGDSDDQATGSETGHEEMVEFARRLRGVIDLCAAGLVLGFGWLQFQGMDFAPVVRELPDGALFKAALTLCFLSWVAGVRFDIDLQELAYHKPPNEGRIPRGAWVLVGTITGVFALLCWVTSYRAFFGALCLFFFADLIGWKYLTEYTLRDSVERAKTEHRRSGDFFRLEQVTLVFDHYVAGDWKRPRYVVSALWIAALCLLASSTVWEQYAMAWFSLRRDTVISGFLLAYIAVMEAWIWLMRLRVKVGMEILRSQAKQYVWRERRRGEG